jgi:hypothetical protein
MDTFGSSFLGGRLYSNNDLGSIELIYFGVEEEFKTAVLEVYNDKEKYSKLLKLFGEMTPEEILKNGAKYCSRTLDENEERAFVESVKSIKPLPLEEDALKEAADRVLGTGGGGSKPYLFELISGQQLKVYVAKQWPTSFREAKMAVIPQQGSELSFDYSNQQLQTGTK